MVLAGKEYGSGSSRDWAAKGTVLLGVRAVIAESYERIHRSNLVGMGVLPLQFADGESAESLGLTGRETFTIRGVADVQPRQMVTVEATADDGTTRTFQALARVDSPVEREYLRHGGILQMVLRRMIADGVRRAGGRATRSPDARPDPWRRRRRHRARRGRPPARRERCCARGGRRRPCARRRGRPPRRWPRAPARSRWSATSGGLARSTASS